MGHIDKMDLKKIALVFNFLKQCNFLRFPSPFLGVFGVIDIIISHDNHNGGMGKTVTLGGHTKDAMQRGTQRNKEKK